MGDKEELKLNELFKGIRDMEETTIRMERAIDAVDILLGNLYSEHDEITDAIGACSFVNRFGKYLSALSLIRYKFSCIVTQSNDICERIFQTHKALRESQA